MKFDVFELVRYSFKSHEKLIEDKILLIERFNDSYLFKLDYVVNLSNQT